MGAERARYHFGPLERRGLVAGWRGGQIASVGAAVVVAILALRSRLTIAGGVVAMVALGGGIALACWPVAGRTAEEWAPTLVRWTAAGVSGTRKKRAAGPSLGTCMGPDGRPCAQSRSSARGLLGNHGPALAPVLLPARRPAGAQGSSPFESLAVIGAGTAGGGLAGILCDRRQRSYTAVLSLQGHSFALLGGEEKERRVAGWSSVLAGLARERSLTHRLQWLALALPDDGRVMHSYLGDRAAMPEGTPARASYEELLDGASTCRHEVLLAAQLRVGRSALRAVRAGGGGDTGAAAVLLREISALRRGLAEADIGVEDMLGPESLAAAIRRSFEPGPRHTGAVGLDGAVPSRNCPPCAIGWPWPMATEAGWSHVRTDGTWHATYWVAEWPRVEVGPEFLGPMLLGPSRRSVSVVMEPVSPTSAVRQVEKARTADLADSELRRRGGFLATARRTRESELVVRREEELAEGHASVRFSGYVTVSAPSEAQLIDACEETEQAAGQSRLELRRLFGDQERALGCTLPLCRGLS